MAKTVTSEKQDTKAKPSAKKPRVNIDENSILLAVEFSRPGNRRRVEAAEILDDQKGISPDVLRTSKITWESSYLDDVKKGDGQLKHWLRRRSLPTVAMRGGAFRIPITSVEEIEARLIQYLAQRNAWAVELGQEFAQAIEEQKMLLGPLFRETDYPSAEQVVEAFGLSWRWIALTTPDKLAKISPALLKQEQDKASQALRSEVDLIRDALRSQFGKLVDHAVEKLGTNENGKRPVFRDSIVSNMMEFIDDFDARNIVGDGELSKIVKKARSAMKGVDPETLRSDEALRDKVAVAFQTVRLELDGIDAIQESNERAFSFDDV